MKVKIKRLVRLMPIVLIGTMIFGGCQSTEQTTLSSNQVPVVISADFFPSSPREDKSIVVRANGKDGEGDSIVYRYTWFINKKPANNTRELPAALFKRGDRISVEIIPNDGMNDGPVFRTPEIQIQNTPPEIVSIQLQPQPFRPGETIKAIVIGKDRERDPIAYRYEWLKNGEPLFLENRAEVKIADLQRGDQITVKVTPHDGRDAGQSFESLHLKSENRRPIITSSPPHQFKHGVYSYPVKAFDPDGDPLQYHIEDPQAGMHFHPETGLFQWQIPKNTRGVQHVTLKVQDSEGDSAAQKVRLDIDFLRDNS